MKNRINFLYCGMADDILTPLLLTPDVTHIYVICLIDNAFCKDYRYFDGQKEDILEILENGNDENSHYVSIYRHYQKDYPTTHLEEPCTIIEQSDKDNCWRVSFDYMGIRRELIYFHHTNFREVWNDEIQNIHHITPKGATFPVELPEIRNMLIERCTEDCIFYDQFHKGSNTTEVLVRNNTILINPLKDIINQTAKE